MAQIVPVVRLAAHAKSSNLYGRSCGRTVVSPNFFGLMGYDRLLLFHVIMGYAVRASRAASSAINRIIHKLFFFLFWIWLFWYNILKLLFFFSLFDNFLKWRHSKTVKVIDYIISHICSNPMWSTHIWRFKIVNKKCMFVVMWNWSISW